MSDDNSALHYSAGKSPGEGFPGCLDFVLLVIVVIALAFAISRPDRGFPMDLPPEPGFDQPVPVGR